MCETVLNESILGRARRAGYIEFACHNIRGYTTDRHGRVDDYGYGGGKGMVMQPEPIQRCFTDVCAKLGKKPACHLYVASGTCFDAAALHGAFQNGQPVYIVRPLRGRG